MKMNTKALSRAMHTAGRMLKKAAPAICTVVGTGLLIKTSMDMKDALDEAKEIIAAAEKEDFEPLKELEENEELRAEKGFDDKKLKKAKRAAVVKTIRAVTKVVYKSAIGMFVAVGLIFAPMATMYARNATLAAACTELVDRVNTAEKKLAAAVGEERADIIQRGNTTHPEKTDENGDVVEKAVHADGTNPRKAWFERYVTVKDHKTGKLFVIQNIEYDDTFEMNIARLHQLEAVFTEKLERNGYVILNDVRKAIGLPATPEGYILGWIWDKIDVTNNVVSFGIDSLEPNGFEEMDRPIPLTFNYHGSVLNAI